MDGRRGMKRYEMVRQLGQGGMGVVFEAVDLEQDVRVAIKTVRQVTPEALFRLKAEFRTLQDLQHPNLVSLGELFEEDGQAYFTMELVDGVDLLKWVQVHAPIEPAPVPATTTKPDDSRTLETRRVPVGGNPAARDTPIFDEGRLRETLRQLAAGLNTLHRAGKVHRDVKPSNILVSREGRVVLLDFGVVADLRAEAPENGWIVGSLPYMSPEQAVGLRVGAASDWYSMGVVLFEALTGALPFQSGPIGQDAQRRVAPSPAEWAAGVPGDLDELCRGLLQFQPEQRPGTAHIFAVLGVTEAGVVDPLTQSQVTSATPFVGRADELQALVESLDECADSGQPMVAIIGGESGVGKSALVRHFTGQVCTQRNTLTLAGRCLESESVPYRAVDGIMDALCQHLSRLDQVDAALLLPPQIGLIARLFPVMRRVPAVRKAEAGQGDVVDPQELRVRAFHALRGLFTRMCAARQVVLVVDDFQWADADSLSLLGELLHLPDAPPLLLVLTVRASADDDGVPGSAELPNLRHLRLGRLSPRESAELAATIVKSVGGGRGLDPAEIARESGGHPLFLHELAHHACATDGETQGMARLGDALRARITRLEPSARRFLEVLAIAGAPLPLKIAAIASGLTLGEAARHVLPLRHQRLAHANGTRASDRVETFHDRVREALAAHLDENLRRELHARLADALEGAEPALRDPRMLVRHLEASGATARAAEQAEQAAALHEQLLAFEQAAELYATVLRLGTHGEQDRRRLLTKRGDALSNAGRCSEAADAYLAAAEGANDMRGLDLRRRAAEQNLIGGHVERGLEQLRAVLAEAGLHLPATPTRALLSLLWNRARLRLWKLRWKPRDTSRIAPRDLEQLDVYRAAALGLSFVDNIRGAGFQARGLRLALELGEGSHVARAILLEAGYRACQGSRFRAGVEPLLAEGWRVAREMNDPYLLSWARGVTGTCDYLSGRFHEAARGMREAIDQWVSRTGATWELNSLRILLLLSLRRMGAYRELDARYAEYRRDAGRRGDRLAETTIARALNQVWLVRDEPAHAREELLRSAWTSETGFVHLQNWYEVESHIEIDLYTGQIDRTRERFGPALARIGGSLLMRIQLIRTGYWFLCGRLALAESPGGRPTSEVTTLARRLEREGAPYALVWAKVLRAGDAARQQDRVRAMQFLREAALLGEEHHVRFCAAAVKHRLGELIGGDEGRPLLEAADAWIASEGVRNAPRMIALFAPGFASPGADLR